MRDLAERGHGFVAQSVAGWVRAMELNDLLDLYYSAQPYLGASDELRVGATSRNYYDRLDVRVEGARSAVWIYRVRDEAAQLINGLEKREHVPIPPPDGSAPGRIWTPETAPAALDAMRLADRRPGKHVHVEGEYEWRTSLELTNLLKAQAQAAVDARAVAGEPEPEWKREPAFMPGDMGWLVRAGLVEERRVEPKTIIYRLTPAGRAARPLQWQGPPPAFTRRPG